MYKIIVLGDVNVDIVMPVPRYPRPGTETVSAGLTVHAGGSAANTAIVLARLGHKPQLIARVGEDAWASEALGELERAGVDLAAVQRDPVHKTGLTFVPVLPGGERTLFCAPGANRHTDPQEIDADMFRDASALHLSGYALLDPTQRRAAGRALDLADGRMPISLDTALEPALRMTDEIRWLLPRLSLLILGRREAAAISGKESPDRAARALVESGVGLVGVTLGAGGCLLANREATYALPAFRVASVDATGAGDAFSAGLIAAELHYLSLPAAAILASALGALATTVEGGGIGLPGKGEAEQFLKPLADETEQGEWTRQALSALAGNDTATLPRKARSS